MAWWKGETGPQKRSQDGYIRNDGKAETSRKPSVVGTVM